ncbi:ABC transporter substrate-binding protein [Sinomonas halotolerans]|uniref:ABC transporter substrate-binding protein n=1 Tax=Sinomonas halotolerans TaxID=1644133 RepID=A0ABU9X394_9MICC
MSQSIDVGAVLGGRYKVTSSIVESHDGDLVLDGVDQVLNRPVSILVSAPGHADQLAQSAREVATGERHGTVQILDLGTSHGATYLITNHTSPAALLDLIVPQDVPYVEPFFTDTLGSEIFGEQRSLEPETYEGTVDSGRPEEYIRYEDYPQGGPARTHDAGTAPSARSGGGAGAAGAAGAAAAGAAGAGAIPPQPPAPPRSAGGVGTGAAGAGAGQRPGSAPTAAHPVQQGQAGRPGQAAGQAGRGDQAQRPGVGAAAAGAAAAGAGAAASEKVSLWPSQGSAGGTAPHAVQQPQRPGAAGPSAAPAGRPAGTFPQAARVVPQSEYEEDYEDDEPKQRSVPWLVGGVLAVVLVAALIFAFTTLGGLFQPQAASTQSEQQTEGQTGGETEGQGSGSPTAEETEASAAPPAVDSVTRVNPGEFEFASSFDNDLPKAIDGNTATYWSGMEFASPDWGGFVKSVALAVKLKEPAKVSQVMIQQSGGSGGNVSVYTNSAPDLTGAKLAGTTSFTGPQISVPVANTPTAEYVIIQVNALPRLSAPQTQYDFGLRLAEVTVQ